ncbi:MAG: exopolysaccharide transport family protein [Pseudomonadota bacterium]|nr:exopolysaccharide transport family protein [Pseudomonadota bacterium]
MHSYSPRTPGDDIDLAAVWRAVAARRMMFLAVALAVGAGTWLALSFVTPLYRSQASILIEQEDPAFLRPAGAENVATDNRALLDQEAVASQVQVLLSRDLGHKVLKDLKLENNSEFNVSPGLLGRVFGILRTPSPEAEQASREARMLESYEDRLSVHQVSKSRVIAVAFESRDPKVAADVANRLAEVYLDWQQKERLRQTRDASDWLGVQIEALRVKVETAEANVEKFRSSSGLFSGSNNVTLDSQQLSELNSQLILAKAQRTEAEARADLIRKMLNEKGDVDAASDVVRSPFIQRLLEQQVRVKREIAELSATLMPSHPRMQQLQSETADLVRQIRTEAAKVVRSLENEAQIAGAREESLRTSLNEMKDRSSQAGEDQIKLRSLEREAKANRDLLESYLARHRDASARRDASAVPASATIISRARIETEPSFPAKGPISLLLGTAAGLAAAGVTILRALASSRYEAPKRSVQPDPRPTPRPVENIAGAALGHARKFTLGGALGGAGASSTGAIVKTLLSQRDACGDGKIFVIPENQQAGAAAEAVALSRALGRAGAGVVLIDMNTRGPDVSGALGVPPSPGLGELLSGDAGFSDVVAADPESSVQVIPAGTLGADFFAGGDNTQFARVLRALANTYDFIVVHSSPAAARRVIGGMNSGAAGIVLVTDDLIAGEAATQAAEQLVEMSGGRGRLLTWKRDIAPRRERIVSHAAATAG